MANEPLNENSPTEIGPARTTEPTELLPNGERCAEAEVRLSEFLDRLEAMDFAHLESTYAELARAIDLDCGQYLLGPEAIVGSTRNWRMQFDTLELRAEKVLRSGRRVLARWTGRGIDSFGRRHRLEGLELLELDGDERIVRQWAIGRDSLTTGCKSAASDPASSSAA